MSELTPKEIAFYVNSLPAKDTFELNEKIMDSRLTYGELHVLFIDESDLLAHEWSRVQEHSIIYFENFDRSDLWFLIPDEQDYLYEMIRDEGLRELVILVCNGVVAQSVQ